MSSFISLNTCAPCSGPIDKVYANCIRSYQNEIENLKDQIDELTNSSIELQSQEQEIQHEYQELKHENEELQNKISVIERINHHLQRQASVSQKKVNKYASTDVQTDLSEYGTLLNENINLKQNIQQLVAVAKDSLNSQQKVFSKFKHKEAKLESIRSAFNESNKKYEELSKTFEETNTKKQKYKAENKRLMVRLTEAEGNINEITEINTQLRLKIQDTTGRKEFASTMQSGVGNKISETEKRLNDAEQKINELVRVKQELKNTKKELADSQQYVQKLKETLQQTQEALDNSNKQFNSMGFSQTNQVALDFEKNQMQNDKINELNGKIREYQREITRLKNENEMLKNQSNNSDVFAKSEIQQQLNVQIAQNTKLRKELIKLRKMETQFQAVQDELENLKMLKQNNKELRNDEP